MKATATRSENRLGLTHESEIAERFAVLDQMINRHDSEGFGPLRKGEESFRWSVVESEAKALLALQADLRVALWLLRALIIQRGLPGLCEGLNLLLTTVRVPIELLQPKADPGEHPRDAHVIALGWLGSEGLLALLRMSSIHPQQPAKLQDLSRSSAVLESLTLEQREAAAGWLAQACASLQAIREEISKSGGLWDRDPSVAIEFITGIALLLSPSKKQLPENSEVEPAAGSRVGPRFLSAGSGVAELIEMLMIQALSEYRLRLQHLDAYTPLPPTLLFREMIGLLGRLSIVPSVEQEIDQIDWKYDHDDLRRSFDGVSRALRRALALVIEAPVVVLPFENQGDGFYRCIVDKQWKLQKLVFAFSADMSTDILRVKLPQQLKLGPVEKIQNLVDLQLPGARLRPVSVAPRHVPYYVQSVYFEVEASDAYWQATLNSAAMALRIVGDFPNLKFEAWGLREGKVS